MEKGQCLFRPNEEPIETLLKKLNANQLGMTFPRHPIPRHVDEMKPWSHWRAGPRMA